MASFLQKQPLLKTAANPVQATLPVVLPSKTVQRYRHYKGGIYELVCEATQESDLSPVIVYKAHNGTYWTRPKSVFFEMLEVDGQMVQRFAPIAD
ncbi:MAG: DUF1653 domain-containing protein [Pseudomonadota bacterium]